MKRGGTILGWLLAAWLAFAGALAVPAAADQAFIEGSEDIPLMQGLASLPDSGIVFDSPAGRIVEAYAAGPVSRDEVAAFYAETLPALGWEAESRVRFLREGEALSLDFFGADGALTVRFTLAPADN